MVWGSILAVIGMFYLTDSAFLDRMSSISRQADAAIQGNKAPDQSAEMRLEAWRGGLQMFKNHPFGVGAGNFNQEIGKYTSGIGRLSPHSLYIQVLAELGFVGFVLLFSLLWTSLRMLLKIMKDSAEFPEDMRKKFQWTALGMAGVIAGYMTGGLTSHLMYSEAFWWFLLMPVCLKRAFENTQKELDTNL